MTTNQSDIPLLVGAVLSSLQNQVGWLSPLTQPNLPLQLPVGTGSFFLQKSCGRTRFQCLQ